MPNVCDDDQESLDFADEGEWMADDYDQDEDGEYDDEPCEHDHDEDCFDYQGFFQCRHEHCMNCGSCRCPGYCDDYQTYNLRPEETGGAAG